MLTKIASFARLATPRDQLTDVGIAHSRHERGHTVRAEQSFQTLRDVERQIFLQHASRHRARVGSSVSGIEHDERERFGFFVPHDLPWRKRGRLEHQQDKRRGHQRQSQPRDCGRDPPVQPAHGYDFCQRVEIAFAQRAIALGRARIAFEDDGLDRTVARTLGALGTNLFASRLRC